MLTPGEISLDSASATLILSFMFPPPHPKSWLFESSSSASFLLLFLDSQISKELIKSLIIHVCLGRWQRDLLDLGTELKSVFREIGAQAPILPPVPVLPYVTLCLNFQSTVTAVEGP